MAQKAVKHFFLNLKGSHSNRRANVVEKNSIHAQKSTMAALRRVVISGY
jgi:P2-related tail formation protein